jgi:hypothetical protein
MYRSQNVKFVLAMLTCIGMAGEIGCSAPPVPMPDPAAPDAGAKFDENPTPPRNGEPCTINTTDCDPDCGYACGGSSACLDLCCKQFTQQGLWCNGQCKPDGCYTTTCQANQPRQWTCVKNRFGCHCASDPAMLNDGTTVASCVADSNGYCTYSFLHDYCNCNLGGGGSVTAFEKTVGSCTQRPTCDCPSACH